MKLIPAEEVFKSIDLAIFEISDFWFSDFFILICKEYETFGSYKYTGTKME